MEEQVKLAHSASIFIGMHGAGIPQIFHAAIGEPNCCSVLELFPESNQGFSNIFGFGNMARLLGECVVMHNEEYICVYMNMCMSVCM